jgi:hypothetical protein
MFRDWEATVQPNNAFHMTPGLAFARPAAGECER